MDSRKKLLNLYDLLPFEKHPLWKSIFNHELSLTEVLHAEIQHSIRTRAGRALRSKACTEAQAISPVIFESIIHTYIEECSDAKGPNHLALINRLLMENGVSLEEISTTNPTPGNIAAIALYTDIASRGAACHILGAGTVEYFYSQISPKIFKAYTEDYHMSTFSAETYRIHGPMDLAHAERAFKILDEAIAIHGWNTIEMSVRDAFVATSLHYDGMLQAATKQIKYWDGA